MHTGGDASDARGRSASFGIGLCALLVAATGSGCLAARWSQEVSRRVERYAPPDAPSERLAYLALGDSCEFGHCSDGGAKRLPTLLFVHGLGASKERWKDVATVMLVQHGHRAVLVDLLGHGDAATPGRAAYQPSAQGCRLAQFVRDRPDLFDNGVVFVGLSYGAVSALEAVLRLQEMRAAGERVPDVLGAVSVSAPAFYYPAAVEAPNTLETLRRAPLGAPFLSTRFFERKILEQAFWHDELILEADREEIRARYGAMQWNARIALGRATLHLLEELIARAEDADYFADVRCPVLVVGGAQDEIVPTHVQRKLKNAIEGSQLVILDDCGHAVARDRPTAFVDVLVEFLESL